MPHYNLRLVNYLYYKLKLYYVKILLVNNNE